MTDQQNLYRIFFESEYKCEGSSIIIFGISGDLAKRKLIPSLFNLFRKELIPKTTKIIGVSRSFNSNEELREKIKEVLAEHNSEEFLNAIYNIKGDVKQADTYKQLKDLLIKLENNNKNSCGNRLFYMSMPPDTYSDIAVNLKNAALNKPVDESSWTRVVIEKPFGHDLKTAIKLNKQICRIFNEDQIYRIDHYLGKETVQNILVFRFGNGIFEPIWNRNYIDHVQITSAETIGIGSRGSYYESSGALKDMVQNHLLQLVAHTAMEPPATFEANKFRDEKVKIFDTIKIPKSEDIEKNFVRGQYGAGKVNDEIAKAYTEEENVSKDSCTETFAAMKLYIQNWRWAGVPFYLRTGKRLKQKVTEINLVFKQTPHIIFQSLGSEFIQPNILSIEIQPEEGISLKFAAKQPGPGMEIKPVKMDFTYNKAFNTKTADSYERLLMDCIAGDQILFARRDETETLWKIVDPVIEKWRECKNKKISLYTAGSWGPEDSDKLLESDGRNWLIMH
jgi:glucose-6-phosphate 1-dehydrogenase